MGDEGSHPFVVPSFSRNLLAFRPKTGHLQTVMRSMTYGLASSREHDDGAIGAADEFTGERPE